VLERQRGDVLAAFAAAANAAKTYDSADIGTALAQQGDLAAISKSPS